MRSCQLPTCQSGVREVGGAERSAPEVGRSVLWALPPSLGSSTWLGSAIPAPLPWHLEEGKEGHPCGEGVS